MKAYMKPAITEVELFTKDAISLSIPKTVYRRSAATNGVFADNNELIAWSLRSGENLSGADLVDLG